MAAHAVRTVRLMPRGVAHVTTTTSSPDSGRTTPIPAPPPSTAVPRPWWALVVCLGAIASLGLGWSVYAANAPSLDIVAVELGGRGQTWPLPAGTSSALTWDYAFIAGYGLALWLGTTAARWVFWSRRAASLARLGRGAAVVVVVADLLENLFLTIALNGTGPTPSTLAATALDAAAIAAVIKFTVLVPTGIMAVAGVIVTLTRLASSRREHQLWAPDDIILPTATEDQPPDPLIPGAPAGSRRARARTRIDQLRDALHQRLYRTAALTPRALTPGAGSSEPRWQHAYNVPGIDHAALDARTPESKVTGFCLSGGGIRSGSVAMGALETLRPALRDADYLVSISGGGYTSGALAQLLTDAGDDHHVTAPGRAVHDPSTAYVAGSVELDHVRRHSSYLATTATQMLVALAILARGLLASLLLLFGQAVIIGAAAAWFYHAIPLAVLPLLAPGTSATNAAGITTTAPAGSGLDLPTSALLAVALLTFLALLAWLLQLASGSVGADPASSREKVTRLSRLEKHLYLRSNRASVFLTRIAGITAIGAVGIPTLVWACGRLVAATSDSNRLQVGVGGSVSTVLLTYLASIASIGWRKRTTIQNVTTGAKGAGAKQKAAVPNGLLQLLLVIVSVGALCLSWLMLLGVATVGTARDLVTDNPAPSIATGILTLVIVLVVGGLFDETSLSLHPFYRRRLASAFASRTVTLPGPAETPTGTKPEPTLVSVPYHPRELTPLSRYARPAQSVGHFPEFIFAAAANLTGQDRTPPGLNAVSFTMSANWVGGPDVGWVRTQTLEERSPARIRRDVTVQAAVAISGAAIASAMGRFSAWYQIVLAVSGARLGTWLPNPVFLSAMGAAQEKVREDENDTAHVRNWTVPGLPGIRRGTYLLRELFNIHPQEERLLQVTDGGHYENLGIVELLRRRCTEIYCIDGGGDTPPTAPGLASAIALAETELGVTIVLHDPFAAEPGAGRPLTQNSALASLNSTLTREPVLTGTIHYPPASGLPERARTGVIYIAKALLWPNMSYPLLSYAARHPIFPHDSTGDQWFNDDQFTAYTQLGRELGEVVRKVKARPVASPDGRVAQNGARARMNAGASGGDGSR